MEGDNEKNQAIVTEAEVEEIKIEEEGEKIEETPKKKRRTDFYIELALFMILGILIGIAVKTEADKKITVGFNDYKMKIMKQDYNINKLQADLSKQSQDAAATENQEAAPAEGGEALPQDQSGQIDNGNSSQGENAVPNDSNQSQ